MFLPHVSDMPGSRIIRVHHLELKWKHELEPLRFCPVSDPPDSVKLTRVSVVITRATLLTFKSRFGQLEAQNLARDGRSKQGQCVAQRKSSSPEVRFRQAPPQVVGYPSRFHVRFQPELSCRQKAIHYNYATGPLNRANNTGGPAVIGRRSRIGDHPPS